MTNTFHGWSISGILIGASVCSLGFCKIVKEVRSSLEKKPNDLVQTGATFSKMIAV